jgi:hypothetical protein
MLVRVFSSARATLSDEGVLADEAPIWELRNAAERTWVGGHFDLRENLVESVINSGYLLAPSVFNRPEM